MDEVIEDEEPRVPSVVAREPSAWLNMGNAVGTPITPAMMDEAFKRATARCNLGLEDRDVFQTLASRDMTSSATNAYYASKAAAVSATRAGVAQRWLKVKEKVTEKQQQVLQDYATEFEFDFKGNEPHDHPMASLMRKVDHNLIWSRIPHVPRVVDVGGNPLFYINEGLTNVHVCGGEIDRKDDSRYVWRDMQAKRLIADGSRSQVSRDMAKAFLAKDAKVVCGKKGQDCPVGGPILLSIHVYDIPLVEWPLIMQKKEAFCVEGCMLYSDKILTEKSGTLGLVEARFEVDAAADKFHMAFIDSPAEWYTHSWKSYVMYGTDHNFKVTGVDEYFSYRIIERRADTIFFRILRGRGRLPTEMYQSQRSPSVDLVKVAGFELNDQTSDSDILKRKTWHFPKSLWYEMVNYASEEYERGALDFAAMYRYYRTVSVKQTINAVLVVGGDPVGPDELVPLVVHACMAAAAMAALGQKETRGLTELAINARHGRWRKTMDKCASLIKSLILCPVLVVTAPMRLLAKVIGKLHYESLRQYLITWEPEVEVVRLPIHRLKYLKIGKSSRFEIDDLASFAKAGAGFDHARALVNNSTLRDRLLGLSRDEDATISNSQSRVNTSSERASTPSVLDTDSGKASLATRTTYYTDKGKNLGNADARRDDIITRERERLAAIKEHISEIEVTMKATESKCMSAFRFLFSAGVPNKKALITSDDSLFHPDVWEVKRGVLVRSIKGLGREDFSHMAVYSPELAVKSTCIRAVDKSKHVEPETGKKTVNYVIRGSSFTGWVFVNDSLNVYNGEEVLDTLKLSLTKSHRYEITVTQAPPGCGKTYAIKQLMRSDGSDMFACPVRESAVSTRSEFMEQHPEFEEGKAMMRTVDSYLTNYAKPDVAAIHADRLMADEVYMTHAGKWYAMAGLLGVEQVLAYGDLKQIPHIPRVEVANIYTRIVPDINEYMWLNYRNPPSAIAAWGHLYDNRLRAKSNETGYFDEVKSAVGRTIVPGTVIMCMYQATKVELRKLYQTHLSKVKIMTAHESEGKTFDHVWLHKTDARKRTDGASLYDAPAHCLVAASRHRKGFLYVNPGSPDLISTWVGNSRDAVRLTAVKDISTAGSSY